MFRFVLLALLALTFLGCDGGDIEMAEDLPSENLGYAPPDEEVIDQPSREPDSIPAPEAFACQQARYADQLNPLFFMLSCQKASASQINQVNLGNQKREKFLSQCYQATKGSCWCDQLVRPNPDSLDQFQCTYGSQQPHQLIHPDEDTWKHAIEAVHIVEDLARENIRTRVIYNWWRPEPYNANVGGAASRHPFGTSVDVRFETKTMQNQAFDRLCQMRARGRLRAIGYYSSTAIHLGVGDFTANTWGKACP